MQSYQKQSAQNVKIYKVNKQVLTLVETVATIDINRGVNSLQQRLYLDCYW